MKKQVNKDLMVIALYQCANSNYKKCQEFEKELEEYLVKQFGMDKEKVNDLVGDALYGSETDTMQFLKLVKEAKK